MAAPSGIVTLLTDFGTRDPFVGIVKGVLYGRFPAVRIVDLTHEIEPQNLIEASFWLRESFGWFPPGTVHLAVVDPGVGTARAPIAISAHDHWFVGPDNGLFAPLLADSAAITHRIELAAIGVEQASATFHGRDVFAPAAALLASGAISIEALGAPWTPMASSPLPIPVKTAGSVAGAVIAVDRFGNLISNIPAAWVPPNAKIHCGNVEVRLLRTYGDAAPGERFALINSFGYLEIAERDGSASVGLSLGNGAIVNVLTLGDGGVG